MSSWHVTPEYINENWTEEQFLLLFRARNSRIKHESGVKTPEASKGKRIMSTQMSDRQFFAMSGAEVTIVVEEQET